MFVEKGRNSEEYGLAHDYDRKCCQPIRRTDSSCLTIKVSYVNGCMLLRNDMAYQKHPYIRMSFELSMREMFMKSVRT